MATTDLRELEPEVLDAMRRAILTEQERRARLEQLPEQIADMARAAHAAGVDTAALHAAIDRGTTPPASPAPTEPAEEPAPATEETQA